MLLCSTPVQYRKLTRDEVIAKYSPIPDPLWTPEVAERFFAGLPKNSYRHSVKLDDQKTLLVRDFATHTLKAKRMSDAYVATLGAILGRFADADQIGDECLISQRDRTLGTDQTIRTIQAQMLISGLLVKQTRPQGHSFVGDVFVYSPRPPFRHRKATEAYLEKSRWDSEGEGPYLQLPLNLMPEDVPF